MKQVIIAFAILLLPTLAYASPQILVADPPDQCLSLEQIILDGDNYILVDGRSNSARIKFMDSSGNITGTGVPTIPLPDSASLPGDILPSPFGLDRVTVTDTNIWTLPATWAFSPAEKFSRASGEFEDRLPDYGVYPYGLISDPNGDVWAVTNSSIINITSDTSRELFPSTPDLHIDNVIAHPIGFVVLGMPDLMLIDSSGIVRWRLSMENILDEFVSPVDICVSSDGTICVSAITCFPPDGGTLAEYYDIRVMALEQEDLEALYGVEDAFRSNFMTGYVIFTVAVDGTVRDVIDYASMPQSVGIDDQGRIHVLSSESSGWAVTILDTRVNQGFPAAFIPYGSPSMISPHALALGPDGSIYWDDIIPTAESYNWGILKLAPSTGVFSLGSSSNPQPTVVYSDPSLSGFRLATAMECDSDGNIWVGCVDLNPSVIDPEMSDETAGFHDSSILKISRSGNLLSTNNQINSGTEIAYVEDLHWSAPQMYTAVSDLAGSSWYGKFTGDNFSIDEVVTDISGLSVSDINFSAGIDSTLIWLADPDNRDRTIQIYECSNDLLSAAPIPKLEAIGCTVLDTDPLTGEIYVSLSDAEFLILDPSDYSITGIMTSRLPGGAPTHPITDSVGTSDGIVILDTEHRALIRYSKSDFETPYRAIDSDIDEALTLIRERFWQYKDTTGDYPPFAIDMLNGLFEQQELEILKRAFVGGRIYNYDPLDTGYSFKVWLATQGNPVATVYPSYEELIY
ncbi:MAG TPA: hypothetical protein VGB30_10465 [bacterium]|jgi:hypothetical protein